MPVALKYHFFFIENYFQSNKEKITIRKYLIWIAKIAANFKTYLKIDFGFIRQEKMNTGNMSYSK